MTAPGSTAGTVAVVGNGAAGTLVVVDLLREATRTGTPLRIEWIGDGPPARGVAYATLAPWHRLNVPATAMTLDEATQTFPEWLAGHCGDTDPFAPREAFGSYLLDTLRAARAAAPAWVELRVHSDRVVDVGLDGAVTLLRRSGDAVRADRVVLALGPLPGPPLTTDPAVRPFVVDDPWGGGLAELGDAEHVLLVGSGLTMVDVALSIARRWPRARMLAISRSGLLPRAHRRDEGDAREPAIDPGVALGQAVDAVHARIGDRPDRWREVVDGLRPVTPAVWQGWTREEQRRFLAEQGRRWEVHRHRMAPAVADEFAGLRRSGRLTTRVATLAGLRVAGGTLRARLEDADGWSETAFDRAVSCAGALEDVAQADDPLVTSVLAAGLARPHPLGLGFDTTDHGAMRTDAGVSDRVFTLGAARRGELYETTAVPEIRDQAQDLARLLVRRSRRTGGSPSRRPAAR